MDTKTTVQQIQQSKTIGSVYDAIDKAGMPTGYNLRFTLRLARAENNQDKIHIITAAMERIKQIENQEV